MIEAHFAGELASRKYRRLRFLTVGRLSPQSGVILGAFGEKLRKQREQRGIELDAISKTTKISVRMLRALEEEHFDQLPGGVFNKGFVRAYARHVGLDAEEAVTGYLDALRESQAQQQAILPDFRAAGRHSGDDAVASGNLHSDAHAPVQATVSVEAQDSKIRESQQGNGNEQADRNLLTAISASPHARRRPPARESITPSWSKLLLALVVIAAALSFWNVVRHRQPVATRPQAALKQSATAGPDAHPPQSKAIEPGQQKPVSPPLASQAARQPPASPARTAAERSATPVSTPETDASTLSSENAEETRAAQTSLAPLAKPSANLHLLIRADETTWVAITADGKAVAHETLIAPVETSVRATGEIVVRAGNSAGIVFELNGKRVGTQGAEGEVRTYVFDSAGVHEVPSTESAPANP